MSCSRENLALQHSILVRIFLGHPVCSGMLMQSRRGRNEKQYVASMLRYHSICSTFQEFSRCTNFGESSTSSRIFYITMWQYIKRPAMRTGLPMFALWSFYRQHHHHLHQVSAPPVRCTDYGGCPDSDMEAVDLSGKYVNQGFKLSKWNIQKTIKTIKVLDLDWKEDLSTSDI